MYLQTARRAFAGMIICLAVIYAPVSSALESLGFTDLNKRVEQIEKQDAYKLSTEELAKQIDELIEDVEEFISENPQNVDALVLSARLGFLEEYFVKSRQNKNNEIQIEPESKFSELHMRLDKAIELYPEYAAAYYWQAALYGVATDVTNAKGEVYQRPIDLQKAIQFAEQAVNFDQKNTGYRQTLATYHMTAGNRKAALEVLSIPEMANNPITLLLKDMEALPLPYGTIFSQEDTDSYIELLASQKIIKNYPMFRVRAYVVPLTVEELTTFFRVKWPGFNFFKQGNRNDMFAQFMLLHGAGLRPSANLVEARAWASQKLGGIALSVQEIKNATEAQRAETLAGHPLPSNLGKNYSYLFYTNHRVVQ